MESPKFVRLSLAAAMTLDLAQGRFYRDAKLYCINLLVTYDDGCAANCSYCGLSKVRPGKYDKKSFIRVKWPVHDIETVSERIAEKAVSGDVKRVCISMVTRRRAVEDTITISKVIREKSDVPISFLIAPTVVKEEDFPVFKNAGADKIGIAIDAVTNELFIRHRGKGVNGPHKMDRYWECFDEALKYFGKGNVGSHFMVGLGETEKEEVKAIQKVRDLGGETHLFAFFPEELSKLENTARPSIPKYRRIQLARYLIDNDIINVKQIKFNEKDEITDFGIEIDEYVQSGKPFMTSGCVGTDGEVACNRPFANEKPTEEPRNFPFLPDENDISKIKEEIWQYTK
ncbi:MAG: radical SAM protein [bacterium]|nr:radical SAM protein [bacterium]